MPDRLNIIGCGRVGRCLARLWHEHGVFEIGAILNRAPESAESAAQFIGSGRAVNSLDEMGPAQVYLIATTDDAISQVCHSLAASSLNLAGAVVLHCSGALSSEVLGPLRGENAELASIHPVMSFAEPASACENFPGTHCAMEGEEGALARLTPAFEQIGARLFRIDPRHKTVYHAGAVMACNYLVGLVEAGLRCFEQAGVPRATAEEILHPLVSGTVANVFRQGTRDSLTGPIARGETALVAEQLSALGSWDPDLAHLYRAAGLATLELARAQGSASTEALRALEELLRATQ